MIRQGNAQMLNSFVLIPNVGPAPMRYMAAVSKAWDLTLAPPHGFIEHGAFYSIVFNLLGTGRKGVGIDVDPEKRQVAVLAGQQHGNTDNGFSWVFGAPHDANLNEMTAKLKDGVLEIVIPKALIAQ